MSPRTVDVPGPLKCINSHPTMEGHLHGDVRGSGLTPNKQGFRAFSASPAMQLACVCICNVQNLQLAPNVGHLISRVCRLFFGLSWDIKFSKWMTNPVGIGKFGYS